MNPTTRRSMALTAAALGVAGVVMIATSFAVNDGPPPGTPAAALLSFGAAHHLGIVAGAWLQAVGTVALCAFAVMLVSPPLAPPNAGMGLVVLGATPLVTVCLLEVALYLAAANADTTDMARLSVVLIQGVQHLYFIVAAPAAFIPLGFALLRTASLPRAFALTALLLGALFFVLGIATLGHADLPARVTVLGSVQSVWWLGAAIAVYRSGQRAASPTHGDADFTSTGTATQCSLH